MTIRRFSIPLCTLIKLTTWPCRKKMRHRGLRWLHRHGHLDSAAVHTLDAPDHAGGWSVDALAALPDWDRQGLEPLLRQAGLEPGTVGAGQ